MTLTLTLWLAALACKHDNPPTTREIHWIDQETEALPVHVLGQNPVRADHDVASAFFELRDDSGLFFLVEKAR